MRKGIAVLAVLLAACSTPAPECGDCEGVIAPIQPPTELTAKVSGKGVTLSWKSSSGATTYNVYRAEHSFGPSSAPRHPLSPKGRFQSAASSTDATKLPAPLASATDTKYDDSTVLAGHTYYYRVTAIDPAGNESAPSNQASSALLGHAPKPVANAISTQINETGYTTIDPKDPDAADSHTYVLTAGPSNGTASVDENGKVTYTPVNGFHGTDSLEVTVTDDTSLSAKLTIPVAVGLVTYQAPTGIPASLTGDGNTRVLIASITPDPALAYTVGVPVTVTATVAYSVPSNTTVALTYGSAYDSVSDVLTKTLSGAGTATFAVTVTPSTGNFFIGLNPDSLQRIYYSSAVTRPEYRIVSTSLPPGAVLSGYGYDYDAIVRINLLNKLSCINCTETTFIQGNYSVADYHEFWAQPMVPDSIDVPVHVRWNLRCGQTDEVYTLYSATHNYDFENYWYGQIPVVPPTLALGERYTNVPISRQDASVPVHIDDCTGSRKVRLTSSANWFSPGFTEVTLPFDVPVTYYADKMSPGAKVEGFLTVTPVDASYAPIEIPVSAVRHDVDFTQYTAVGLNGVDDGSVNFTLPFTFPAAGTSYTQLWLNSNGTIDLGWDYSQQISYFEPIDNVDPNYLGGPMIAPLWGDKNYWNNNTPAPDLYAREVTDITGHYEEFLTWDQGTWYIPGVHLVYTTRLYDDGRIVNHYDQLDLLGLETIGYYRKDGSMPVLLRPTALKTGQNYTWGPY